MVGLPPGSGPPGPPAAGAAGGSEAPLQDVLRLMAVVVARGSRDLDLLIDGRRWSGRSAAPLPETLSRGARVPLDLAAPRGGGTRGARLHVEDGPPVQLMLRPRQGGAAQPAARAAGVPPTSITIRTPGTAAPPVQAHLTLPALGRPAADAAGAAASGTAAPDRGRQAPTAPHRGLAGVPASGRIGGAAIGGGGAGPVVVEAEVAGVDAGRHTLLRVGTRLLQVEEPLHLPPGARVQLTVPRPVAAGWAGGAPDPERPAPGARSVAVPEPDRPEALRPDATLARRMLDLARHLGLARRGQEASGSGATGGTAPGARNPPPAAHAGHAQDQAGAGFRQLDLPFGHGSDIVRLGLHVRAEEDPKERPRPSAELEDGRPRRAIVAVDFERLGPCQLDVLCQGKRFDLQVRSLGVLPEASRRQISGLFRAACDAAGLEGGLQFAPGRLVTLQPVGPPGHALDV